ncbi:uncharacterized protein A4U43_C07F5130 [Asparagus officinalis]|uniref:2-oxoacid dehydrogenase acyltransferase catalytic domain-containing protein n=1 Tax=Asparagus officinalis TaxID=4686 RepID=A0A5P1ECM5_ASPOF|nr:uncharacterized protein A4U43_C07F5130 [Asparagus officinalis]
MGIEGGGHSGTKRMRSGIWVMRAAIDPRSSGGRWAQSLCSRVAMAGHDGDGNGELASGDIEMASSSTVESNSCVEVDIRFILKQCECGEIADVKITKSNKNNNRDEISKLHKLASNNKLSTDDVTGGTITLSNIGTIGGKFGSPVINLPEAAITAIGPMQKLPLFRDDGSVYPAAITKVSCQ